mgnify:CR=1 FL=1
MSKYLVTGGAGFIGFHTARALLARGEEVTIVDNFNDYYDPSLKEARIKVLEEEYPQVKVVRADITNEKKMEEVFREGKFDKVCHLAAQAGVRHSLEEPRDYERSNVLGTLNILEQCRWQGVKDLVFASSSSVYGDGNKVPYREDDRADKPISIYAATKKANEEMAYTYHRLFGLNVTGLRFFTVYGPWGRPDMGVFQFVEKVAEKKPIEVYNFGKMARDFTYVDDIVSGVKAALDKSFPYEIFNLARGESVNLLDYIKEVEKNFGRETEKIMKPLPAGDMEVTSADISKAKEMLGYEPKVSVGEGVKRMVEWYRGYYKKY